MPQKAMEKSNSRSKRPEDDSPGYQVRVSARFVLMSMLACVLVAFAIGSTARSILIVGPQQRVLELTYELALEKERNQSNDVDPSGKRTLKLPNPVLKNGKLPPPTTYTSKNFDTARSATFSSRWVVTEDGVSASQQRQQCDADEGSCPATHTPDPELGDGEIHLPAGQHLLMDIRNVEASFLASEEQLAEAMLEVVGQCGLTLLSYHCHGLDPEGVTCVGVLLESHVSFHTWPTEGVITLDLFTCGPNSLLPIVSTVEELFSVPRPGAPVDVEPPEMIWAYKLRGFGADNEATTNELTDLFTFPIGAITDYKKEIASVYIGNERLDIYDVLRPSFQSMEGYKRSLLDDSSYEAQHPEVFMPDRIVFINGVLQSRRSGDAPFHELLVHPAMFAHREPKNVAIIGGADGAILREVLKHNTVEKVVMIDYEDSLVNLTMEHFPEYHDCSFLKGGTENCLDDPRVQLYYEDASAWFKKQSVNLEVAFDVVIMDELECVRGLDQGVSLLEHLPAVMSEEGVFVATAGESWSIQSPAGDEAAQDFVEALAEVGFESVLDYEESHGGFDWPWQFVIAFKSFNSRVDWFGNEALVNIEIRRRAAPTKTGLSPFLVFDGATQQSVMYPSRASETVYCRSGQEPYGCDSGHGFDPDIPNLPMHTTVGVSSKGSDTDLGLFAKQDIPFPSYVGLDRLPHRVYYAPQSYDILHQLDGLSIHQHTKASVLLDLQALYGFVLSHHGEMQMYADTTVYRFIGHGCKGTSNFGYDLSLSEDSADPNTMPEEVTRKYMGEERIYNPALERRSHLDRSGSPLRPIQEGEEILYNYLALTDMYDHTWEGTVRHLMEKCSAERESQG